MMQLSTSTLAFIAFSLAIILLIVTNSKKEYFSYLNHKTKCFACEQQIYAQYGPDAVWMAQPTKGFDDEKESIIQTGSGWLAKTIKGV
jgi:hypothetical protein